MTQIPYAHRAAYASAIVAHTISIVQYVFFLGTRLPQTQFLLLAVWLQCLFCFVLVFSFFLFWFFRSIIEMKVFSYYLSRHSVQNHYNEYAINFIFHIVCLLTYVCMSVTICTGTIIKVCLCSILHKNGNQLNSQHVSMYLFVI